MDKKLANLIVGVAFGKFSKILPIKKISETDKVVAFWHPKPSYKNHILIVPKKAIKNFSSLENRYIEYVDEIFLTAKQIVQDLNLESEGYSIIMNGGKNQEVKQLHFHLVSGGII